MDPWSTHATWSRPKATSSGSSAPREHWPGGSFRGFDVPSGIYTWDTAFALRLVDGRVSERRAISDDPTMMLQLGAIIPSSP